MSWEVGKTYYCFDKRYTRKIIGIGKKCIAVEDSRGDITDRDLNGQVYTVTKTNLDLTLEEVKQPIKQTLIFNSLTNLPNPGWWSNLTQIPINTRIQITVETLEDQ